MLTLVVQDREGKPISQYPLSAKPEVILGRANDVDIPLLSKNVSRRHAKIRRQGKQIFIEDLGSANGVILNGARIQGPAELKGGAEIRIGDFTLVIATQGEEQVPSGQKPTASLLGQNGTFQGKVLWLKPGDNVVGRGSESDVVIVDGSISRKHAVLTLNGAELTVRDLGSSNGTFIGEQRIIGPTKLPNGGVVRFGSLSFLFSVEGAPSALAGQSLSGSVPQASVPSAPVASVPVSSGPVARIEPQAASGPVNWLGVVALLLTPLSLFLVLGIGLVRIFGSPSGEAMSLADLRAALATGAQMISAAEEKKSQGDWIGAEEILQKILEQNPGDPRTRALYTEVHFQAENLRHLRQAQALLKEGKYREASEEARKVEEESDYGYEAELLEEEANRRRLAGLLLRGAEACEQGQYQDCLKILCGYLREEPQDPDTYHLARLALNQIPPPASTEIACVANLAQTGPADPRGAVEKLYEDTPALQNAALLFFEGDSAGAQAALKEALLLPEIASAKAVKAKVEKALHAVASANAALNEFDQHLAEGKLNDAERAAKIVWQTERTLFVSKRVEGALGMNTRRKLIDGFIQQALSRDLTKPEEWADAKKILDGLSRFDSDDLDIFRYAAEARLNAALREGYEAALVAAREGKVEDARKALQALLPLLPKGLTFRASVEEKWKELAAPPTK